MKLLFCIASLLSLTVFARPLTPLEKQSELRTLATLIQSQYGPYEYKESFQKVSFEKILKEYLEKADRTNNLEFSYLLNQFVAEFKDSHFSSRLNTDYVTKLGFFTDRVQGKVLIDEVDRSVLSETVFPFHKGDEIVSLGGRPIEDVVSELEKYMGMGNPNSAKRIGSMLVSFRQAKVVPPQAGKVVVQIRKGNSAVLDSVELEWKSTGSPLIDSVSPQKGTDYGSISIQDLDEVLPKSELTFRCSGKTRIEIPKGAVMVMEKPFVAYYYSTSKGNVGYLRIPHYHWQNEATKAMENDLRFSQYEYVISELEKNTVGLVIDQDHNCGGQVKLVEQLVSLFADKPFIGLEFQFLASRAEYLDFSSWLDEEKQNTLEGKTWKEVLDLIKTTWVEGKNRLTPKTTFNSSRLVQPNSVRYTKPVLILIDEMSGSGGDAFPAMMQGHTKAKLFGSRTMGAGGHVVSGMSLPYTGNQLNMTKSLFFHPNGTAIENNGAVPDYSYEITRDDFVYGYREYRKTYTDTLLKLIP